MIKVGYLGDVVVFDRDLLTVPPDRIMSAQVDYTIVGGKVVYDRNAPAGGARTEHRPRPMHRFKDDGSPAARTSDL